MKTFLILITLFCITSNSFAQSDFAEATGEMADRAMRLRQIELQEQQMMNNARLAQMQQIAQINEQEAQAQIDAQQRANTMAFLDAHPDIVFRSPEYNQIADLVELGYDPEDAYKIVVNRRSQKKPSLDEIWEQTHPTIS